MNNKKMTKKEAFKLTVEILGEVENTKITNELLEILKHEIELLENKTTKRKPSKNQTENIGYREAILSYLGTVEKATATEVFTAVMPETSVQRVTMLLTGLKGSGEIIREVDKRKTYFRLA